MSKNSTKAKTNLKNLQIVTPQPYSQKDIFQRLSSHSLHPIDELKAILKELFINNNAEAKKQFETIFSLEEKLKKANYQSQQPIHLDMPSTSKKIFFNPRPYEKVPISEYKIVDNQTFSSGPFYRAEDISKRVFTALKQTGKTFVDAYKNDPKSVDNKDNSSFGIYTLPTIPLSNVGTDYFYNRLVTEDGGKEDEGKKDDFSSTQINSSSSHSSSSSSSSSSASSSSSSSSTSSSSSSTGTTTSFTSPDKLKEALLQLHFVIATVIQRAEAARQDRELLIRTMQDTLEEIENEQVLVERQNELDSEDEEEGEGK